MPNQFITPTTVARRSLAILYNAAVLAGLVHRDYDADFTGKQGDTVNVRVPASFVAHEFDRDDGIVIQSAEEQHFPVVLNKIADVSFQVTSEELTLELEDFDEQLLSPAMEAIVQKVDADLAETLVNASGQVANPSGDYVEKQAGAGVVTAPSTAGTVLIPARTRLNRNLVPNGDRYAVVSPEAGAEMIQDPLFHQADKRGDTAGLQEAAIGRKFGFDTYETQVFGFGPGVRGQADGVAFHRDAITLASRTLQVPLGKDEDTAATASYKGLGLRVVYDYDITKKRDTVSIDFLYGVRVIRPIASVELDLGQGS